MKSKKILAVLMAAGMTLSLAACGSSSDSTDKSADNGSDSGKTYKRPAWSLEMTFPLMT